MLPFFPLFFSFGRAGWRDFGGTLVMIAAFLPTYLWRFSIGPIPTTFLEVLWLITAALFLLRFRPSRAGWQDMAERARPWLLPCALLLVSGVVSVAVAPDIRASLGLFRAYLLEPIFFFLLLISLPDESLPRRAAQVLFLPGLVIAVSALLQPLFAPETLWEGTRATSFYPFPNAVGLLLGPIVLVMVGMVSMNGTWQFGRRPLLPPTWKDSAAPAVAAILMLAAIVAAQSEGAIIGVAAGLFTLGVLHQKGRMPAIIAAVVIAVLVLLVPQTRNLAAEKLLLRDWSGTVRRITWGETVEMLKDRPLTGAGLAGYPVVMRDYHKATAIEIFQYPHQIMLNTWSELGLLGLVAFGWILITFFRVSWAGLGDHEGRPYAGAAIAAMVALLVHGLVDVPYFKNDLAFLFWIIVALGTARALPKNEKRLA